MWSQTRDALPVLCVTIAVLTISRCAMATGVRVVRVTADGLQPQVCTDDRNRVHCVFFGGDVMHGDIFYVRSDDDGTTFTSPIRVDTQPGSAIGIGAVRGPHLALGRDDRILVTWMGSSRAEPKAVGDATPLLFSRSTDDGGFERQRNLIQVHAGLDGGGAVTADRSGNVYVAWHATPPGRTETDGQVWLTRSTDNGEKFYAETAVSDHVGACGCCAMNVGANANGEIFVLFRSASRMGDREMRLLVSTDHGASFSPSFVDPFRSGVCPMSTCDFGHWRDSIYPAWQTDDQIRFARVTDQNLATPSIWTVPGSAAKKHPTIAVNRKGEMLVAWTEGTGWNRGGSLAWQVFDREGHPEDGTSGSRDDMPAWDTPASVATATGGFTVVY